MIILPDDKSVVSLLPLKDAKQLLVALFSEDCELQEMTPLANMAYTVIKGRSDQAARAMSATGKAAAPKGNRNTSKQAGISTRPPSQVEQLTFDDITTTVHDGGEEGKSALQEQRFDEFWAAYPRKVGKEASRKAWRRIKPTADHHAMILAAIERAKNCEQWRRDNGQYIPNPATWLNQGRWDDEVQPYSSRLQHGGLRCVSNFTQREYDDEFFDRLVSNEFGRKGRTVMEIR